jgi:hypothetical protein
VIQALGVLIVAGLVAGGLAGGGVLADEGSTGGAVTESVAVPSGSEPTASDPEGGAPGQPAGGQPSPQSYCSASQELNQAGRELFSELRQQGASQPEFRSALRGFVEDNVDVINDLRQEAPPAIDSDVRTVVAGNLAQAGIAEQPAPSQEQVRAAEQRVNQYENKNC